MLYPQGLYAELLQKRSADPATSWTAKLMQGGTTSISKKISEEATELALAARELELARTKALPQPADNQKIQQLVAHTSNEAADLLYHYLVLLAHLDIPTETVCAILETRRGTSGIAEKRYRNQDSNGS